MNKQEILDNIKRHFDGNESHVTLLGKGALVVAGILDSCEYIELNCDKTYFDNMKFSMDKEVDGETYRYFEEGIYLCCKNMTVYKTERTRYGFSSHTIPAAVTYLRDQVGAFRYELCNLPEVTEDKIEDLKRMLDVLKVAIPNYTNYKKQLKNNKR